MNKISRKKFSLTNNVLLLSIIIFFLVKPAYFSNFAAINKVYKTVNLIIFYFLIIYSIISRKKTPGLIWIFLFFGAMLLSTVFGSKDYATFFNTMFPIISMCLLFEICLNSNPRNLFKAFRILEIMIYINFFTIILFPNGIYKDVIYDENWFLGYKNPQIRTILPIVSMAIINSSITSKKINTRTLILIIVSFLTFIMIKSTTSLIGFTLYLVFIYMFREKREVPKKLNLKFISVFTAFLFSLFSVFKMQYLFKFIIVDILGEDLTFHGRTQLWDLAIDCFKRKPLFGYGYLNGGSFQQMFGSIYYTHPHNFYLYILITGGIFTFIVLMCGIFYTNKKIVNKIDFFPSKIVLFTLSIFLIMGITESLTFTVLLYPMIILGMNMDKIYNIDNIEEGK